MSVTDKENSTAAWFFLVGVIIAVFIGVASSFFLITKIKTFSSPVYGILVVLGLIIGFSIKTSSQKDAQNFLLIGAVLVIVSKFGMESVVGSLIGIGIGDIVSSTFAALLTLFVPATIIVALKAVFLMARI